MLPDVDTRDSAVQPNLDTVLRSRLAGFDLSRDAIPSLGRLGHSGQIIGVSANAFITPVL